MSCQLAGAGVGGGGESEDIHVDLACMGYDGIDG